MATVLLKSMMSDGNASSIAAAPPKSTELLNDVVTNVRGTFMTQMHRLFAFVKSIPGNIRFMTTEAAALLISLAIIALCGIIVFIVYLALYNHPRVATLSRAGDLSYYMENTYFPHLHTTLTRLQTSMGVLKRAKARLPNGRIASAWEAMQQILEQDRTCPPVDQLTSVIPINNITNCDRLLSNYFKCYSYFKNSAAINDRGFHMEKWFFHLPEDATERINFQQWQAINGVRAALSSFASATASHNPDERLWVPSDQYQRTTKEAGVILGNPSAGPAARFAAALQSRAPKYSHYMQVAQAATTLTAACLELHLLLNEYVDDLVLRHDSRTVRAWGNPYIFYYFLGSQTRSTGDSVKRIWGPDKWNTVPASTRYLLDLYEDLGDGIDSIPHLLLGTPKKPTKRQAAALALAASAQKNAENATKAQSATNKKAQDNAKKQAKAQADRQKKEQKKQADAQKKEQKKQADAQKKEQKKQADAQKKAQKRKK